jgi:chromosome segregation protein
MDAIRSHIEDLETEQETQGSRIAAAKQAAGEKRQEARSYGDEAAKLEAQAADLSGGRREEEDRTGKLTGEIASLREEQVAARAERESALVSARELEALMASMQGEMESKEQVIDAIRQRNAELREMIAEQEALCQQYVQTAEEKKSRLQSIQTDRLQLEGKRASLSREIQSKNNELINLERERGRLENKKTQAEMEEDSILQKLWDNYELTRVTGKDVRVEIESTSAANRRIGELRGAMKKLGSVNLEAIEEYEKVSQRFEFLSAQRDDLEKAKADLLGVIGDLTKNMKEIFGTQFAKINEAFGRTFVEIFGGGSAALRLEDESDILNCGIEIRVELPGKSMRAISLLSGGEKAFVAIALYFAILKVRPTPFCVLDEIEAALDDVNVQRYAAYMRTLCEQTQFIVITHRRGTMEGSDILYGVTMQEQGVTKLLALYINEVEEHIKAKIS